MKDGSGPRAPGKIGVTFVPHTHWDREWYRPFQVFRTRSIALLDGVLDILEKDLEFRHFHLDGQAILLEDYLEACPEQEARIRELARGGRLSVGPWYVLPDEFLVSGESLIRNLLAGRAIARELGGYCPVGYLPDQFGHIAQLPQILRRFGIEAAVLWRGLDYGRSRHNEFWWVAPDGSRVLAVHLPPRGYGGLVDLSRDREAGAKEVKRRLEFLVPRSASGEVLLLCGDDHWPPDPGLPGFLERLSAEHPGMEVRLGSLGEFFAAVRAHLRADDLVEVRGELISPKDTRVLQSVYSTRTPLKQLNFRCETLLERWAEPTSVYAGWLGEEARSGLLRLAWKWLLRNHPHDSICSCSVDAVERDMRARFAWCQEIAEELVARNLRAIARRIDTAGLLQEGEVALVAFNPSGHVAPQVAEGEVFLPEELLGKVLMVRTPAGEVLPLEVLSWGERPLKGPEPRYLGVPWPAVRARLRVYLPGLPPRGYVALRLAPGRSKRCPELHAGSNWIENGLVRLTATPDGRLELLDKETGQRYPGLHRFEDVGDRGDTYTFDPVPGDLPIHQQAAQMGTELGPLRACLVIHTSLEVPERLASSRSARAGNHVQIPIKTAVYLHPGSKRVEFVTTLVNTARDHRLRVLFPTGVRAQAAWAEEAFAVVRRRLHTPQGESWTEAPYPTRHFRRFVYLGDEVRGFGLVSGGLPEYEVLEDEDRTLALTLLRCVGWLSRHDLTRRRDAVGPLFPTPGAQCLGEHRFEYAIYTGRGPWQESGILREAELYTAPPRLLATGRGAGPLPPEFSFLRVDPPWLPVSALKPAEGGQLAVLRLYNPGEGQVKVALWFPWRPGRAVLLDLAEGELGELPILGNTLHLTLGGGEIATVGVVLEGLRSGDV